MVLLEREGYLEVKTVPCPYSVTCPWYNKMKKDGAGDVD